MAESLLSGAAVGAVFGELLKAVLEIKDKATLFKRSLAYLRSTLEAIAPVVKEIEQHNNDLGRPKEELQRLIKQMEEGTKLVNKCSNIHSLNYRAKVRYLEQLKALVDSLVKFFIIDMQAQAVRDQKETLIKVTRILSAFNKLSLVSTEDTTGSYSDYAIVPVDVSELDNHDSVAAQQAENALGIDLVEQVMEHVAEVTSGLSLESDPMLVDVSESESESESDILGYEATQTAESVTATNFNEQVMGDITSPRQKVDQSAVVLKISFNCGGCEGCIRSIRKNIREIKGVISVNFDGGKDLVTVKGTMNVKEMVARLKEKLKRDVEVVPPAKVKDN